MSSPLARPESFTVDEFLSPANVARLDETLQEIFGMMVGVEIFAGQEAGDGRDSGTMGLERRKATVGFSGAGNGSCEIHMGSHAVLGLNNAMLGGEPVEEFEEGMCDAVGELCNMVAGGWKNRVPALESCSLEPPRVSRVRLDEVVSGASPVAAIHRRYTFVSHRLRLTLVLESVGGASS